MKRKISIGIVFVTSLALLLLGTMYFLNEDFPYERKNEEVKNIEEQAKDDHVNLTTSTNKEPEVITPTNESEKPTPSIIPEEATSILTTYQELPYTKEELHQLPAETIIDINKVEEIKMDTYFYYEEISETIFNRIKGISYGDDCTVPLDELRYVRVLHYGFDEQVHIGELIVNKAIAQDIIDIFQELYEVKYPIERMVLVDEYNGDDNLSMANNNTSSFNYRPVPGATNLSKHAYGSAIDINPLYNPYVQYTDQGTMILPVEGTQYADRNLNNPYYIRENDVLFQAFTKRGFSWGGFWKTEPDYQHFVKKID